MSMAVKFFLMFGGYLLIGVVSVVGFLFIEFRGKPREDYKYICYHDDIDPMHLFMITIFWPLMIPADIIELILEKCHENKEAIFDILYKIVNVKIGFGDKKTAKGDDKDSDDKEGDVK